MIISHKYRFIFIKTGKTAGTSIELYLSKYCGPEDVITPIMPSEQNHIPRNYMGTFKVAPELSSHKSLDCIRTFADMFKKNKFYNHIAASRIKARISSKVWDNYFKFCVERNPWDKTLSHYHFINHKYGDRIPFSLYLALKRFAINYPLYTDGLTHSKIIVDKVVKYERLSEDLTEVFNHLGIPFDGFLGIRAKANYRKDRIPYQKVFSQKNREIVQSAFSKEVEMHGYKFDS
jgi:hypothetical protein